MSARTIVLTGASDGVGAAAARHLVAAGERVVLVGRSPAKTQALAAELGAPHHVADFADLGQVRELATALVRDHPRIDVLANNAGGIMGSERRLTGDGFEETFQVNHLAPFLLTHLLLEPLVAGSASVLQTASAAARAWGALDLDDLGGERRYSATRAYGTAKLANILFSVELHRRFHSRGISAAAFHPGVVATSFGSGTGGLLGVAYRTPLRRLFMVTPEEGARRLTWLVDGEPGVTWQSGRYYERDRPARSSAQAHDADLARALWDRSAELLGLS